jgi:hypothetical protein
MTGNTPVSGSTTGSNFLVASSSPSTSTPSIPPPDVVPGGAEGGAPSRKPTTNTVP